MHVGIGKISILSSPNLWLTTVVFQDGVPETVQQSQQMDLQMLNQTRMNAEDTLAQRERVVGT